MATLQISGNTRPYGILSNGVLPFRIEKDYYPSVDHYLMASMLQAPNDKSNLLSYTDLYHAKIVYNQLDEAQYRRLLEKACLQFYNKKCKDRTLFQGKSLGVWIRNFLKEHKNYVYQPADASLISSMLGINNAKGYNILGQVLETLHQTLKDSKEDIPEGFEYLFWKLQGKKPESDHHFRLLEVKATKVKKLKRRQETVEPIVIGSLLQTSDTQEDEEDNDEIMMGGGAHDEEEEEILEEAGGEAIDYLQEDIPQPPMNFKQRRKRPEHLHFQEGRFRDILDTEEDGLEHRTNPMHVFQIYKVVEYLMGRMNSGHDILRLEGKTVVDIFYEANLVPPALLASPETKRFIQKDCWDMFRAQTMPYYHLVRQEILYPHHFIGFIRKEKIKDLNADIGREIQKILFHNFLEQVLHKKYPMLEKDLLPLTLHRESQRFSADEFQHITNNLYHLYFNGKFQVSRGDAEWIQYFEKQRKTPEEIQKALHFMPSVSYPSDSIQVQDQDLLNPLGEHAVRIENKLFTDLYQYLYFCLFQFFGDVSPERAYQELHQDGNLLPGNHSLLQERLHFLIQTKRQSCLEKALRVKFHTYPQVKEMLIYIRAKGLTMRFQDPLDSDTARGWSLICQQDITERELELMKCVLKWTKGDFEKSIFLYSFLHEFFRNMDYLKTLVGKRLGGQALSIFFSCFYKNLMVMKKYFHKDVPHCPLEFEEWIEREKVVSSKDIGAVWERLYPYIYQFGLDSFHPSKLFAKIKGDIQDVDQEQMQRRIIRAFVKIVNCVFPKDHVLTTPHLYLLASIFTGKDNLPPWRDPSYEYELEEEIVVEPPLLHLLPKEIKDKLPIGKKKKKEKRSYRHDLIHPEVKPLLPILEQELQRDVNKQDVSQMSFALASVLKNLSNKRRAQFFLA